MVFRERRTARISGLSGFKRTDSSIRFFAARPLALPDWRLGSKGTGIHAHRLQPIPKSFRYAVSHPERTRSLEDAATRFSSTDLAISKIKEDTSKSALKPT